MRLKRATVILIASLMLLEGAASMLTLVPAAHATGPTVIGTGEAHATTVSSVSVSVSFSPATSSSTMVFIVIDTNNGASAPTYTASDSGSDWTWGSAAVSQTLNSAGEWGGSAIFSASGASGVSSDTFTVSFVNSGTAEISVIGVNGIATGSPAATSTGTNLAGCTPCSVTSMALDTFVITGAVAVPEGSATSWSGPSGFSAIVSYYGVSGFASAEAYSTSGTGSSTLAFTYSSSPSYTGVEVAATWAELLPTSIVPISANPTLGATAQTVSISGCQPSPASFTGDGKVNGITADQGCSATLTLPSGYAWAGTTSTTHTVLVCSASPTCSTVALSYRPLIQHRSTTTFTAGGIGSFVSTYTTTSVSVDAGDFILITAVCNGKNSPPQIIAVKSSDLATYSDLGAAAFLGTAYQNSSSYGSGTVGYTSWGGIAKTSESQAWTLTFNQPSKCAIMVLDFYGPTMYVSSSSFTGLGYSAVMPASHSSTVSVNYPAAHATNDTAFVYFTAFDMAGSFVGPPYLSVPKATNDVSIAASVNLTPNSPGTCSTGVDNFENIQMVDAYMVNPGNYTAAQTSGADNLGNCASSGHVGVSTGQAVVVLSADPPSSTTQVVYTTLFLTTTQTINYSQATSISLAITNWAEYMMLSFLPTALFTLIGFRFLRWFKVDDDRAYLLTFTLVLFALSSMSLVLPYVPVFTGILTAGFLVGTRFGQVGAQNETVGEVVQRQRESVSDQARRLRERLRRR